MRIIMEHQPTIFNETFTVDKIESNIYTDFDGNLQKELFFSLKYDFPILTPSSYRYNDFYLSCNNKYTKLSVKLYEGTLKYFFKNYKDYYYLPAEDTAIHKDIASSVDKAYRKKATAETCYLKKTSLFLPQYEQIVTPAFYKERKDVTSYFELSDEFLLKTELLHKYVRHILMLLSKY